jgi:type IV pilus assembly protein PilY1
MLIMGGGYDDCEDYDPDQCTSTNKGNVVYLLNAETRAILKTFNTDRGVVGDVTIVTAPHSEANPNIRVAVWAYLADLGGNIYRISGATANSVIGSTAPADWTITKIASLGCADTATACDNNRKFFFGPDVVYDAITETYVLLIGSGDREKPVYRYLDAEPYDGAYGVDNFFFSLRDKPTESAWLAAEATNCGGNSLICMDSLYDIDWDDPTPSASDLASKPRGWALGMRDHEQVVTSAITVFGITTFSTHIPEPEPDPDNEDLVCTSGLGTASVFNVGFSNAAPPPGLENRFQEVDGGGLPPSPVAGQVELDDGEIVPFIIGGNPRSALEGSLPSAPALSTRPKSLTYWYIER